MNRFIAGMTIKKVKVLLVVFCLLSGGLSIYFIVSSLVSKPAEAIKIERVRMPENLNRAGDEVMENKMDVSLYEQIQEYKKYMDSLGEPIRKSLLDSILVLEEIYLQQQK